MLRNYFFLVNEQESQLKEAARKIEKFLHLAENSCFLQPDTSLFSSEYDGYEIFFYNMPLTGTESIKQRRSCCAEREDINEYAKKLEAINLEGTVFYHPVPYGRVGGITFPKDLGLCLILERLTTQIAIDPLEPVVRSPKQ